MTTAMSTVAVRHGTYLAMKSLPVAQGGSCSFHLPLHRFVAACLREVARRPYIKAGGEIGGIEELLIMMKQNHDEEEKKDNDYYDDFEEKLHSLFQGLIEFPTIVLSRSSQIRSGLWKRNGPGMLDQVLNYAEPPFCRSLRDADLVLIQFVLLGFNSLTHGGCECVDKNNQSDSNRIRFGCAHFVNLLLHRLGIFEFVGFATAPDSDIPRYLKEEKESDRTTVKVETDFNGEGRATMVPSAYTATEDVATSSSLMEELLHTLVIVITELPPPPAMDMSDQTRQAKQRLRREVVHRLVSGPKTHSELAEVHHVLPLRDNSVLSEEGKLVNPDDATGAALESALKEVTDRRSSGEKLAPDKWVLRPEAWAEYDPAFFHISLRSHQHAAENRPKKKGSSQFDPIPYAPSPPIGHKSFLRLRRDITSDSTVIALIYRTLHVHCRNVTDANGNTTGLRGKAAYDTMAMRETLLARAIHLLTLGVYAWDDEAYCASPFNSTSNRTSGDMGSIFYKYSSTPTQYDWIERVLLRDAKEIMDSDWYDGEENILKLLHRLANECGSCTFSVQDTSIKSGAAWLCKFARKHSKVASIIGKDLEKGSGNVTAKTTETDIQRRSREARERVMKRMQENMVKFASMVENDVDDGMEIDNKSICSEATSTSMPVIIDKSVTEDASTLTISLESETVDASRRDRDSSFDSVQHSRLASSERCYREPVSRLLIDRPRCIICADDGLTVSNSVEDNTKKGHARKPKPDKILAFCGYVQASTVLKGGGGTPHPNEGSNPLSSISNFVGTHVSLCGHAVHTSCFESHLKDLAQRNERNTDRLEGGKRGDFQCPMCRQLSNCLIPFIDVGSDWVKRDGRETKRDRKEGTDAKSAIHSFLSDSKWWAIRNDSTVAWNGRCSFLPAEIEDKCFHPQRKSVRKGVKPFVKKDLYIAWTNVMETPRFVRKRKGSPESHNLSSCDTESSLSYTQENLSHPLSPPSNQISAVTDVWRRVMDQCADVSYKADLKRLGEERLQLNFGEFRHYLVEKFAFNEDNDVAPVVDWPECIMPHVRINNRRQELSRERLIAKLMQAIQSFTYSCCAEELECKRLGDRAASLDDTLKPSVSDVYSKYGVYKSTCDGKFLILSDPSAAEEGGLQIFCGRIGRLRYLALAIMAATSAVSREVVQLALDLPDPLSRVSTCELENADILTNNDDRAPLVFPLLCGHVLTHVVAAMCAVCGRERARSDMFGNLSNFSDSDNDAVKERSSCVQNIIDDLKQFIQLGFLARILQVLLGCFQNEENSALENFSKCESMILGLLSGSLENYQGGFRNDLTPWEKDCYQLLRKALSVDSNLLPESTLPHQGSKKLIKIFFDACEKARSAGFTFLCNIGLILQVLTPTIVPDLIEMDSREMSSRNSLDYVMTLIGIKPLEDCLSSPLVCEIIGNWYKSAKSNDSSTDRAKRLDCARNCRVSDWPLVELETNTIFHGEAKKPSPLIQNFERHISLLRGCRASSYYGLNRPHIQALPISYTDLYAELTSLLPDSEVTAVCLVCGEVIDGKGKGRCTKHAFECGGGCGIFFLLQECVGLILHKEKAAYVHSPYVDSHGETPQYRGRPLNLDLSRYNILHKLWSGHLLRQEVISERSKARHILPNNFY